jgi:hypothetical protein
MNRRQAILTALASVILKPGGIEEVGSVDGRKFSRYDVETDSWALIQPKLIQAGDVIWVRDVPPSKGLPGNGHVILVDHTDHENQSLYSAYRIDPATNQWVEEDGIG